MYTITINTKDGAEVFASDTLENLTNALVDEWERWKGCDPDEYWPVTYWANPGTFTLDDDEQPPAKPDYTPQLVKTFAQWAFDVAPSAVSLTEVEDTFDGVAHAAIDTLDVAQGAAIALTGRYYEQVCNVDGVKHDPNNLPAGVAAAIFAAIQEGDGFTHVEAIDGLEYIAEQIADVENTLDELKEERDRLIRRAASRGVPQTAIADSIGVSRTWVYKVLSR